MPQGPVNRLHLVFNAEHKPYLYGAIHIVDGDVANQWWERPFVISKRRADGETFYGTIARTLTRIKTQLARLEQFRTETERRLATADIKLVDQAALQLPDSEVTDQILDAQDELIEDVLLSVSVYVRVLSEIFPSKMKRAKAHVYDYDDKRVDTIELSDIANLLLHQRYIVIRGEHVVDLISDEQFMSEKAQLGLKISFPEYVAEVERALNGLTVKDLIGKLWGETKRLSTSSSVKDIVFLTQNLFTLGGFVVDEGSPIAGGPLKPILDRVANQFLQSLTPQPAPGKEAQVQLVFRTPRFQLEPDLNDKRVRVTVEVNGKQEQLVLGYEDFFSSVANAHGNMKLSSSGVKSRATS